MRPLETLDRVTIPNGPELSLHRRDDDYYIHLDGQELMSTRVHGSESALAEMAWQQLGPRSRPRFLIGGLGLGFTLRAALQVLPKEAEVVVAELFPKVVEWNAKYLADRGPSLEDPRTRVQVADVAVLLKDSPSDHYDAVLLDVDNGPSQWCLPSNCALYKRRGLQRIKRAIVPGGILAVWSAYQDPPFVETLRQNGFEARSQMARGHRAKGRRHTIFFGRVPS